MKEGKLFFLLALASSCYGQNRDIEQFERYSNYIILSNFYQGLPEYTGYVESTLQAYLFKYREPPKSPKDLLVFCKLNYHPNELIIDDFELDQLRLMVLNETLVLYFIGPDGFDDECNVLISIENVKNIEFKDYNELKGDFILGGLEMEVVNFYSK
jgi:hypothetical protein